VLGRKYPKKLKNTTKSISKCKLSLVPNLKPGNPKHENMRLTEISSLPVLLIPMKFLPKAVFFCIVFNFTYNKTDIKEYKVYVRRVLG
jgi:hypothetical protein